MSPFVLFFTVASRKFKDGSHFISIGQQTLESWHGDLTCSDNPRNFLKDSVAAWFCTSIYTLVQLK